MSKSLTSSVATDSNLTASGRVHIGTSGWHYHHWRKRYYPPELPADQWLTWYARDFDCVEVNNSFYQLPSTRTIERWCADTPQGFGFAVKASRLITHLKKLKQCEEPLAIFLERISHFGPKLGPILFQLPPHWHLNVQRLEEFLPLLPNDYRYTFEFRDPSWHCPEVYQLLKANQMAFCLFELAGLQSPEAVTSDFVYVRLHGPGAAYCGCYPPQVLGAWGAKIRRWQAQGQDVYCFFDNDQFAYAVINARQLTQLT